RTSKRFPGLPPTADLVSKIRSPPPALGERRHRRLARRLRARPISPFWLSTSCRETWPWRPASARGRASSRRPLAEHKFYCAAGAQAAAKSKQLSGDDARFDRKGSRVCKNG